MKKLNEITIADLMPDSISGDPEVSATAQAIDPQLKAISEAVNKPLILASIDELSEGVLEHLAVQYDVTAWNSAWPIETKQAVLKTAIADKRKMGTRGAVQRAIEAVAPIATITEWWQDTGGDMPPHTFEIDLLQEGSAVDAETQASVIAQVNEAKPVRSHFTFSVGQMLDGNVYFAGVLRSIAYARVRSAGISIEQMGIEAGILAAMRGMSIRRLLASSHMGEMPEPTPPDTHPSFIIVDEETGTIVHSVTDEGMEFAEVGHILMPDSEMILVPEASLPLATFYLNPEGRDATENHTLALADNPVFDESGNNILYADYPDLQGNRPFCFMRVDNTFFLGGEGDSLINWSEGKAGIGALASRGKSAWSVSFEVSPSELTAYFTTSGANNRDTDVGRNSNYYLYDENGQQIYGDASKTYTITGVYKADRTKLDTSSSDFIQVFIGKLMWYSNVLPSTGTFYYAYRLTYTVS